MSQSKKLLARNFPTAVQDVRNAAKPGLYAGPDSSYDLAFADTNFLLHDELRPVRMQLELLKPELVQQEQGVESTIVIFGSARIKPPEEAKRLLAR
ncbi:MAG TPA: 3-isopropylmalate dehydrogenase, partial [Aquabacterium sp.]|nr:3-isopropylmalate dehydrogenase [Aquabacterium sp.]